MIRACTLSINRILPTGILTLIAATWAAVAFILFEGITFNQTLAIAISLVVLIIWVHDRYKGFLSCLVFYLVKPLLVRISYTFDLRISNAGGSDLLGITPALLLTALIIWNVFSESAQGRRLCNGKTKTLMVLFAFMSFASVFNPANAIMVGLGGFERNILPNMLVLFLTSAIVREERQVGALLKTLVTVGLFSTAYGIGQFWVGLYPWEIDWIRDVAFRDSTSGWLTVGLRGVEFRIFSIFYGYMDFFFSNVLIYALVMAYNKAFDGGWRKLRTAYILLWYIILILSMERMPLVMTLLVTIVICYLKQSAQRRARIAWVGIVSSAAIYATLVAVGPYLVSSGAEKLVRLAEMADPLDAASISDRAETKWGPAFETIKSNPFGVGVGYGSQTRAKEEAIRSNYFVQPHNELIQKTLEVGVMGGVIYLFLLISVFKDMRPLSSCYDQARKFGSAMVGGTMAFWVCGMVNLPFSGTSGLIYWALAGVALALKGMDASGGSVAKLTDEVSDTSIGGTMQNGTPTIV